jgi:Helicase associated domain
MNMSEWEREAAAQGQSESAKEEDNESNDDDEQWRAGYLAAPQQPYPDHHYAYGSYNTPAGVPASAIADDAIISFPRYQAYASFPYHGPTAGDSKLDGTDVKSAGSDQDEKKPAALPVGATLDHSGRHRSFDDSDDETAEWIEGYDPMTTRGQVIPAYAPPPRHFVAHHPMPRDLAMHPDRHVEHARYEQRGRRGQPVAAHRSPSDEELRESQTPRSKLALKSWYDRFNELIEYMAIHGDCNVPQKYEENPKLGVVS